MIAAVLRPVHQNLGAGRLAQAALRRDRPAVFVHSLEILAVQPDAPVLACQHGVRLRTGGDQDARAGSTASLPSARERRSARCMAESVHLHRQAAQDLRRSARPPPKPSRPPRDSACRRARRSVCGDTRWSLRPRSREAAPGAAPCPPPRPLRARHESRRRARGTRRRFRPPRATRRRAPPLRRARRPRCDSAGRISPPGGHSRRGSRSRCRSRSGRRR